MADSKPEVPQHVAAVPTPPTAIGATPTPASEDAVPRETLLLSIPPPAPYDLYVRSLDIGLPSTAPTLASKLAGLVGRSSKKRPSATDEKYGAEPAKDWIVRDVDAVCKSGEVLALIGGSGSGKTSLLNAIAGRLGALPVLKGEVEFVPAASTASGVDPAASGADGATKTSKVKAGKVVGFVRQNDYLLPYLTVRETLTFAASLRLPRSVDRAQRAEIVEQTILELGLSDVADVVVGGGEGARKGISGGERRRLSIGCTLVTLPSVLILDEPTSGLDAFTSHLLLLLLSHLASRGRTVILSLHAPRSDAFEIFDRLCVLSKGEVAYSGPTRASLGWFGSRGLECGEGVNPLDFLVDITSVDVRDPAREDESKERVGTLVAAWKARSLTEKELANSTPLTRSAGRASHDDGAPLPDKDPAYDARRPGVFVQTAILLKRSHLNVYRNVPQLFGFAAQAVVIGLLMGLTFFQLGESPADVQSVKNASFQLIPAYFYLTQVYWIWTYCNSLVIFDREREDRLYAVAPWVLSEFLSVLLPSILAPFIYAVILFTMAGLRHDPYASSLFIVASVCVLVQWAVQGLALLAASIVRQFAIASLVCNAASLFMTMASGFLLTSVPAYVAWFRWISFNFYGYRIIAPTLLEGRTFACPGVTGTARVQCDGDRTLAGLLISTETSIGVWYAGLIGMFVVEHALAALALHFYHPGGVKFARATSARKGKENGMTDALDIPRQQIDVEIDHLSLKWTKRGLWPFSTRTQNKTILRNVTASFPAGEVSAIIGPSGAGKSTILQLLAHRHLNAGSMAQFKSEGALLFNGEPSTKDVQNSIAFVEQDDDYHLSGLTVRETLRYAAILRLPASMTRKSKLARAEDVLLMLGLNDCANVLVGGALVKGISGGEKRRLSLAVQMISDPSVLVVDEPTSGLDSFIAANVMECLTSIARTGRTVIATIHQPRSEIVKTFDGLTVLAKGGALVYSGPYAHAMPWFEAQGFPLPSKSFNPADHILDVVSVDPRPGREAESAARVVGLINAWGEQVHKVDLVEDRTPRNGQTIAAGSKITPLYIAFPVVLERMVLNLWRQREAFFNRLTQAPLLGLIFLLFYQRITKGPAGAQDRIGVTLENVNSIPFVGLLNGIAIFPLNLATFKHEYSSGAAYSAGTFLLAYSVFELSMTVLAALLYGLIMNVAVGLQTSVRIYFEFSTTLLCLLSFGESIAVLFCTFVGQMGLAVSLVSTVLACCCQISGLVSLSMPKWLAAIAWATPMKGATKVQFINEARGLRFNCDEASIASGRCVATTGDQMLQAFGFEDLNTARFLGIMVATTVAWRVLAWACLRLKMINK